MEQLGDEAGPAGLMRGAGAAPRIAVKIFVELQVVAEMRVALQLGVIAEYRPFAVGVAQEQARQAALQLARHAFDGGETSGTAGTFDLEVVAVVVVEPLQ